MKKKIKVIMSTYNGQRYLVEQIESILEQKNVDISLVIRDDGSSDNTPLILHNYEKNDNRVKVFWGRNVGFRKSFFQTLQESFDEEYDYYAFSDQDDVWMPDKLSTAIEHLEKMRYSNKLYASSLNVVDKDINFLYKNSFKKLNISFGSALSRQRLGGCTMVFDKELARLCLNFDIDKYKNSLISHDGAVYYICLACGGRVFFDESSYIYFRRHNDTVTEHGRGLVKRLNSIINIFSDYKNSRFEQNRAIYETYGHIMPSEVKDLSEKINSYRESLINRLFLAFDRRIKCGVKLIDFVYFFAIIFGFY